MGHVVDGGNGVGVQPDFFVGTKIRDKLNAQLFRGEQCVDGLVGRPVQP